MKDLQPTKRNQSVGRESQTNYSVPRVILKSFRGEEIADLYSRTTSPELSQALTVLAGRSSTGDRLADATENGLGRFLIMEFVPQFIAAVGIDSDQETDEVLASIAKCVPDLIQLYPTISGSELSDVMLRPGTIKAVMDEGEIQHYGKLSAILILRYFEAYYKWARGKMDFASKKLRQASEGQPVKPSEPDQGDRLEKGKTLAEHLKKWGEENGVTHKDYLLGVAESAYHNYQRLDGPMKSVALGGAVYDELAREGIISSFLTEAQMQQAFLDAIAQAITCASKEAQRARSRGQTHLAGNFETQKTNLHKYERGIGKSRNKDVTLQHSEWQIVNHLYRKNLVLLIFEL